MMPCREKKRVGSNEHDKLRLIGELGVSRILDN